MGEHKRHRVLDVVLVAVLGVAAFLGACSGLTESSKDHVEVGNESCVTCHRDEYVATTKPPHIGLFSEKCADCHSQSAWAPAPTYPHDKFPLVEAHATAGCFNAKCHGDPPKWELSDKKACVDCHKPEYDATTKPPHAGIFPEACAECHTQSSWIPAKFSHPFPLIGPHANPQGGCNNPKCHGDPPKYQGLPTECVGCHQDDYDFAVNVAKVPGHSGYPKTCDDCHNSLAWKPATPFAHVPPLTGAHTVIPCTSCHELGKEKGTPQDCVACHKSDYDTSPYPGHQSFPTTCTDCHSTTAWKPAAPFKHLWPLNGAHAKASCTGCHKGNPPVYKGTSTACVSCHKADHDAVPHTTTDTVCDHCHTTNAWKPATPATHKWPLTGAHTGTPCASCHVGNPPVYAGTPTTCVGCHLADYNGSPYPNHATFSKTCTDCHTTNAWKPASGAGHPNTKFPISSGAHSKFACNECHNSALGTNGKGNADCVGCHTGQHTRLKMDAKHKGEKGYPTGTAPPNFCLTCHPSGKN